ncbi:MAG: S8 family serine peptidase [Thiohalomonadales bacterium]
MLKKYYHLISIAFFLLLSTPVSAVVSIKADLQQILNYSKQSDLVDIIVDFSDEVNVKKIKLQRSNFHTNFIASLRNNSSSSQQKLIEYLASKNITNYTKLWMINSLAVTVEAQTIPDITALVGVSRIRYDRAIQLDAISTGTPGSPEWNITQVNAPAVWNLTFTGQNVVIGSLDTGVDVNHQDLVNRYRGGINSWFDPFTNSTTPYDMNGHGTSVMGIIVGGNASGTNIGVAPGAMWISAKIFDDNGGTQISKIHAAYQWMLDPDGNPNTRDEPSIINNSWNFESQAKPCDTEFQKDINALLAADISVVFSSGNNTNNISPANNGNTISVGALDESLAVKSFSGRGPSACQATGIYPNIVAPGEGIFTAGLTSGGTIPDSYVFQTGTSFSAPHITGALAILKSAFPTSTRKNLQEALSYSAIDLGQTGEDSSFGWGYLNIHSAYLVLERIIAQDLVYVTLPPVANNETKTLFKDSTIILINLLENDAPDTRIDNLNQLDPASIRIISGPNTAIGSITTPVNGIVDYTPAKDKMADNSFTYTVKDKLGNESNIATVRINSSESATPVNKSGGCTLELNSRIDPVFPLMIILSLWFFIRRILVKKVERF